MESAAARIAQVAGTSEAGTWQRHAAARTARHALDGRVGTGHWGSSPGFPVLYLGRPVDSVVIEAYRHLIDPVEVDNEAERGSLIDNLLPRILITCDVNVTRLLDLRTAGARAQAGLTIQDLLSPTDDRDAYERCQQVAAVAHQLGRHGIIAPAATGRGETLALFTDLLPAEERPLRSAADRSWDRLPADPRLPAARQLRVVRPID